MLLKNWKQFISCGEENTSLKITKFSVPQKLILGPLFFPDFCEQSTICGEYT